MGSSGPKKLGECVGSKEVPSLLKRAKVRTTGEPVKTRSDSLVTLLPFGSPFLAFLVSYTPLPLSLCFLMTLGSWPLALYSPCLFVFIPSCASSSSYTLLKTEKVVALARASVSASFPVVTYFFTLTWPRHSMAMRHPFYMLLPSNPATR